MSPDKKPSFMDRGTIVAFAVILLFWFGWTKWLESSQPMPTATVSEKSGAPVVNNPSGEATAKKDPSAPTDAKAQVAQGSVDSAAAAQPGMPVETTVPYTSANWDFDISSQGMGLKNIRLKDFTSRDGKTIQLASAESDPTFATRVFPYNQPLNFEIQKVSGDTFVGRATAQGATIEKTLKVNPVTYSVATTIAVTGATAAVKGFSTRISDVMTEPVGSKGWFDPTPDFYSWFLRHDGEKTREALHHSEGGTFAESNVSIAALSVHYFAMAIADKSPVMPRFESNVPANSNVAFGQLVYEPAMMPESLTLNYTAFAGPKSYNTLLAIDEELTQVIDYGMFAVIAKPILWLLKYLYSIMANWGVAIIVLTIIVRLIVLPFNVYSYKSMKVMQKLQPDMTRIRERYKDKPPEEKLKMNAEIMGLMKEHKANPLGGCLPMLLQLPVFIALYQVLGQSIELYQAPFGLWIHDLSLRDPFFVLPVLMGISMFVQQKITPSTMDPQQAKIMMWMPVIFAFFMISLPSGLTLYIFVSTLFGIIQQYIFMRDKSPSKSVQAAKA